MPSVYVSHSYADRPVAARLIADLQAKGFTTNIEADDAPGASIIIDQARKLDASDVVVLLWSEAASQSGWVHQEIQRAIKAWSNDRLVIARLDATELPSGLADLPSTEFGRDFEAGVRRVVARAEEVTRPATRAPESSEPPAYHQATKSRASGAWIFILSTILMLAAGFLLATKYIWPSSPNDGPPDIPVGGAGIGAFESEILVWVLGGLALIVAAVGLLVLSRKLRSPTPPKHRAPDPAVSHNDVAVSRKNAPHQIFISYSRRDGRDVDDLVRRIERAGYTVWIDRRANPGGGRYAGPIVAAIRGARVVAVMCSTNSAKSDHVVREIYVAGDFKKPFIVFELDDGELPDELLYFLTGFPRLQKALADTDAIAGHVSQFVPA